MKVEFEWNQPIDKMAKDLTGGPQGLLFLASTAARLMDPYVPADNLMLAQNMDIYLEGDHGVVHYLSPYAHYQWEGELYVDPDTGRGAYTDGEGNFWSRPGVAKVPSGKPLQHSTFKHPLATSHWDKAMMTARKDDLVKSYENYLKGRD